MTAQQAAAGPGIPHYPLVIDGQRTESGSRRRYPTTDPFLQAAWAPAADGDAGDVDLAVAAARRSSPAAPGIPSRWAELILAAIPAEQAAGSQVAGQHGAGRPGRRPAGSGGGAG